MDTEAELDYDKEVERMRYEQEVVRQDKIIGQGDKMSFFVSENDTFDITVYAWKNKDNQMEATDDATEVPVSTEVQTLVFTLRQPNLNDNSKILSASITNDFSDNEVHSQVNLVKLRMNLLEQLLLSWKIPGEEEVPCTLDNIRKIHPVIGQVVATRAALTVKIF